MQQGQNQSKAYYIDETQLNEQTDIRLPLRGEDVDASYLPKIGVQYFLLSGEEQCPELEQILTERGYKNRDQCKIGKDCCDNYQQLLDKFKQEHLHMDEEIRYILDGSGYFDLRSLDDRWIRFHVTKGDLLIVPEGIYHRFTTDTNDYVHAMRLFQDEPKWTPYNRPCEDNESRIKYVNTYLKA